MLMDPTYFMLIAGVGAETVAGPDEAQVMALAFFVLMALGVSFLCSIAEAVLLSLPASYIEGLKEKHPRRAERLMRLKTDKLDQALAAILTLNTIAHTVGAIGAGAQATAVFGEVWFGLFSAVMTLLILFLSEIVPKTIGAIYWKGLAMPVAQFIRVMIIVLFPVVWVSEKVTRWISKGKTPHSLSREEFISMTRVGEKSGEIEGHESKMIRSLLRFEELKVVDIMTPRTVVAALPENLSVEEALDEVQGISFSRLPLYEKDLDGITSVILKENIFLAGAEDRRDVKISTLGREVISVPETQPLSKLMEDLLWRREHIAVVLDEYGGTSGLVTMEDLVETLTGFEIMDETDDVQDMRELARKRWKEKAKGLGDKVGDASEEDLLPSAKKEPAG